MEAQTSDALHDEIVMLGAMLGDTVRDLAGPECFEVVEAIRVLSRDRRLGASPKDDQLQQMVASLPDDQLQAVIRAFSLFLDLANLAEDRQRVRVLAQRERDSYPNARRESIPAATAQLVQAGRTPDDLRALVERLHIELVFTAHPTEAKRRSVRAKLRRIRQLLSEMDQRQSPSEREQTTGHLRAELAKLWQTSFTRPWRPSVLQEVQRGLSIRHVLWNVTPQIQNELRTALVNQGAGGEMPEPPCLTFGSWIGGDRDGHPYVTTDVTEQTIVWLRQAALELHLETCRTLYDSLSIFPTSGADTKPLQSRLEARCRKWSQLAQSIETIPPNEIYRRWLRSIRWRLEQTQRVTLDQANCAGAYASSRDLEGDIQRLAEAFDPRLNDTLVKQEILPWLDNTRTFGFHLARLDVRQDSQVYATIVDELLVRSGLHDSPQDLSEDDRQRLLAETLDASLNLTGGELSDEASETLALFRLLRRAVQVFGPQTLGGHVVSMTRYPSDLLTVLWLWRAGAVDPDAPDAAPLPPLPVIPLFETIDDLENAAETFDSILKQSDYREYVQLQGDRQTVMIGYSDSTKDGGYLSACWSLQIAQQQLHATAERHGVELTFFHGRGGSLGRGGGPAARGILSLPAGSFRGSLRLTEQGEVLAERYDDPRIALRHLEQVVWSSMLSADLPVKPIDDAWKATIEQLADDSLQAYRQLVEQPGFVEFFRRATPISDIEELPIGSRPSRRRGGSSLSDLRAIPWVFSWTQSRCLIPAWYGMGAAMEPTLATDEGKAQLRAMYRDWPFFRATIDNAVLALAKTDLEIAERYAGLADDAEVLSRIGEMISQEFQRSKRAVLAITENQDLLDDIPWLKESIQVRNWYIDPLNLIQIELMRRKRASEDGGDDDQAGTLRQLIRLTIKGIAAGMRTTG